MAALVAIASLGALMFVPRRWVGRGIFAAIFAAVLIWYFSLKPSNNRDWQADVSVLPWFEIHGDQLVAHNVRNCDYRSETDYTPRWHEETFNLSHLHSVDFALVYWGSKKIAHGIICFDFDDGGCFDVSIETRKEKTESYSTVEGFFRQYELIYVVADERDVLRLRTNFRNEDVYLYRTTLKPDAARAVLLSYVDTINSLRTQPEWYNALTSNCITSVIPHLKAGRSTSHNSWRTLLSGYAAQQAYENGGIETRIPYEQLEARSYINPVARAVPDDADFSKAIRAALPDPFAANVTQ
jgi:hypothetical protein